MLLVGILAARNITAISTSQPQSTVTSTSENASSQMEYSQIDHSPTPASDPATPSTHMRMEGIESTTVPQCPTGFQSFSRLPTELRYDIYDLALREYPPQTITVTLTRVKEVIEDDPSDGDAPYGGLIYEVEKCLGLYKIHTLLQVSVEARQRALLIYKSSFEDCFFTPIYFDARRDTLFLDSCSTLTAFKYFKLGRASLQRMAEVQNLAIGGLVAIFFRCLFDRKSLTRFETLSSLLLERGEPNPHWQRNDAEERAATTWFSECWSRGGTSTSEEGAIEGSEESSLPMNKGPTIHFIGRQEMVSLGMRPVGLFSVS